MSADHQKVGDHWFGIRPPDGTQVAWGARALLTKRGVDILHDRQSWRGNRDTKPVDKMLKELIKRVKQFPTRSDISKEHIFQLDGWECRYNTRASFGYLYIVIFPVQP